MSSKASDVKKLQDNLSTIRKIAGWSAQELGKKIGVTKQTISNLENKKTEMTLTQYIAIRTILDYEIAHNTSNELLPRVVHLLLDVPDDELSVEDRAKIDQVMTTLAAASVGGIGLASLVSVGAGLLGGIAGIAIAGATIGSASWLDRIVKKKGRSK